MSPYQKRKSAAREQAIAWQLEFDGKLMSWAELAYWQARFEKQGKRYGLIREFRENGIL